MTLHKRLSITLQDIIAIQFRCQKCKSVFSQTKPSTIFSCQGCKTEWREQKQQEYMIAADQFLKSLERLKKKEDGDPSVEIALEFVD